MIDGIKPKRITPENITQLEAGEVFVFGSNYSGRHGAGAAKLAMLKFGAIYGQGLGMTGRCYAIATKDCFLNILPLKDIDWQIKVFIQYAQSHPSLFFLVTKIGTGLANYSIEDIANLFSKYNIPDNISLPKEFWSYLNERSL